MATVGIDQGPTNPPRCGEEDSFLGFKRKTNGKLDGRAQGFGVSSDWPDLNDLCWRTGTELKWTSHSQPVEVPDAVIEVHLSSWKPGCTITTLFTCSSLERQGRLSCLFKEPKI